MTNATVNEADHALWLTHPVTEWVLSALAAQSDAQREHWNRTSWDGGVPDAALLAELRTRADTLKAMQDASYFDLCDALEQDPIADSR